MSSEHTLKKKTMDTQDWEPVVFKRCNHSLKGKNAPSVVAKNGKGSEERDRLRQVENEQLPLTATPLEVRKTIQQARQRLRWSQSTLAQRINVKPSVVNDYESGKAIHNNTVLRKMERALNTRLLGKEIGAPLAHHAGPEV